MDQIRYSSDGGVFNLPWLIAEREGFFREEHLDVQLVHRDPAESESECFSRKKETDFLSGRTQLYTVCSWGGIKRTAEREGGRIVFRLPMDAQYSLVVSPRSGIAELKDLATIPVGVSLDAGSHYAAVETLETHVPSDSIEVKHVGAGLARLEALLREEVKAAVLLEPYTTIALKRGARLIVHCRPDPGAVVAADALTPELLERFARATNRAVDIVNAAPEKYVDVLLEEVPDRLREEVDLPRYRPMGNPVSADDFEQLQNWMVEHGMLSEADATSYAEIVRPVG